MKNRVEIEMFVLREILKKIEKRDIEEKKNICSQLNNLMIDLPSKSKITIIKLYNQYS